MLSHTKDDGGDRPIAYASRSLTATEKGYAQLEKEALLIIFGIQKFHNYLYGHKFIIESDHEPLFFLFSEKKGIPHMASARIQRWALTLSAYQYTIHHKSGTEIGNANGLSQLPIPASSSTDYLPGEMIKIYWNIC